MNRPSNHLLTRPTRTGNRECSTRTVPHAISRLESGGPNPRHRPTAVQPAQCFRVERTDTAFSRFSVTVNEWVSDNTSLQAKASCADMAARFLVERPEFWPFAIRRQVKTNTHENRSHYLVARKSLLDNTLRSISGKWASSVWPTIDRSPKKSLSSALRLEYNRPALRMAAALELQEHWLRGVTTDREVHAEAHLLNWH